MSARTPRHLLALFALGAVVLLLSVADLHTPVRPVLTLVFFSLAPGAAFLVRLRDRGVHGDVLMEASLAVAISVVVTMAVAQVMVWTGVFSPAAAVLVVLAVMAAAVARRRRPVETPHLQEVSR